MKLGPEDGFEEYFEVRNKRRRGFFTVDNDFILKFGRHLHPATMGVYNVLAMMADQKESCYPSQMAISTKLGISTRTVVRAIKKLEECNLIRKTRKMDRRGEGQGKFLSNVYLLLDKSVWKLPPSDNMSPGVTKCQKRHEPGDKNDTNQVTICHPNNTKINNTKLIKQKNLKNSIKKEPIGDKDSKFSKAVEERRNNLYRQMGWENKDKDL